MFLFKGIGLRLVEERDLEKLRVLRNSQTTWLWLTDVKLINQIQQQQWYKNICLDKSIEYYTIVEEKEEFPIVYEGDFLGIVRITNIDLTNRSAMIGLDIKPDFRGQGIGTKAFKAILEYFFNHRNFHRLHLVTLDNNEIARKLYINAGLKEEGRLRQSIWRHGKWHDCIAMSILEDEYQNE